MRHGALAALLALALGLLAGSAQGQFAGNAKSLRGVNICTTDPTTSQALVYDGTDWCPGSSGGDELTDADGDTKVEVEQSADDDTIRMTSLGVEAMTLNCSSGTDCITTAVADDTQTLAIFRVQESGGERWEFFHTGAVATLSVTDGDIIINSPDGIQLQRAGTTGLYVNDAGVLVPAGTVGGYGWVFDGDTYIYRPDSNEVRLKTAGSDRLIVDANYLAMPQNVGAAPGATCVVGTFFIDTDETDDTNCTTTNDNSLCLCVATDTWVAFENN